MAFGFNYYEDQQFQADANASAKSAFEKQKTAPPPEHGYFDRPAPRPFGAGYPGGMEYEPLDGNIGYLIASGVRAFEDIGKAGAVLLASMTQWQNRARSRSMTAKRCGPQKLLVM